MTSNRAERIELIPRRAQSAFYPRCEYHDPNPHAEVGRAKIPACSGITTRAKSTANERKPRQYTGATGAPSMLIVITRIRCGKRSSSVVDRLYPPAPACLHDAAFHRRDMTRIPEGAPRCKLPRKTTTERRVVRTMIYKAASTRSHGAIFPDSVRRDCLYPRVPLHFPSPDDPRLHDTETRTETSRGRERESRILTTFNFIRVHPLCEAILREDVAFANGICFRFTARPLSRLSAPSYHFVKLISL